MFRSDVGCQTRGAAAEPGGGDDVDDDATGTGVCDAPGRLTCAEEYTSSVHTEDLIPGLLAHLQHRHGREDSGVVDPDVETAQFRDGTVGRRRDRRAVGDIHRDADGVHPVAFGEFLGGGDSLIVIDIADQ